MTDEEKKAIEDLKEVVELYNDKCLITTEDDFKSIEILLNLIEKQSKEIEELSDKLTEKICKGVEEEILEEYRQTIISKDKEIEELKKQDLSNSKIIANMSERHFHDREKIRKYEALQDKIKAKIEYYEKIDNAVGVRILESLLEKE